MKIQIIGYSGSGKSTLAAALGRLYDIPVLHLDNAHWYGAWQERSDEEMEALVADFMSVNTDGWIIDGNYSRIAPVRFTESDMTVFLDFGRLYCFFSAWRRYRKWRGASRESCPCPEKFDKEFRRWLLFDGRTRARQTRHLENLAKTSGRQIVLKNRPAVKRFIATLQAAQQIQKGAETI